MTIRELKEMLDDYDEDKEVVFKPDNSNYVYNPTYSHTHDVRTFWGKDFHGVIIHTEQIGSI